MNEAKTMNGMATSGGFRPAAGSQPADRKLGFNAYSCVVLKGRNPLLGDKKEVKVKSKAGQTLFGLRSVVA